MSQKYARVVLGAFTLIRYEEADLRFGTTIADIVNAGDQIVPVIETLTNTGTPEAPVFRAPTAFELANVVATAEDLAKPLYHRDMGIAGGVASLNEDGDVLDEQIPDEVVEYLGTWDPTINTPALIDGIGDIGDTYAVADSVGDVDYAFDISAEQDGSREITLRGGMTIIYRDDAMWHVQGSTGLSAADRLILENSMQNLKTYELTCVPAAPAGVQGGAVLAQLSSANNPHPEFQLVNAGELNVSVNAMSGEMRVIVDAGVEAGDYDVQVRVAGSLGQSETLVVPVTVSAAV